MKLIEITTGEDRSKQLRRFLVKAHRNTFDGTVAWFRGLPKPGSLANHVTRLSLTVWEVVYDQAAQAKFEEAEP